ncbi:MULTISPECIES: hypothetical protein [unclassified Mycobacterium]|uniref:hypothetical protein n=1 Tax=unclassified Mycobacterium TaxID=2642494 RepID=UPI0007404849|nr:MULTISPECIES: hypothetical protein [unclassified Mycobacterium]KUH84978.1 hypothetical protein AU185_00370 [Mycobacterium sp. GA-0227b]KUH87422.1 hypothetical protein AU186_02100 [Mycobacterium sp. GA-1999]
MAMVEVEPQPRIDTIVRLASGGDVRRTEYVGTAWFDGKPIVSGLVLRRPANTPKGIRTPNFSVSFFIPDSLAYDRATLGSPTLSVSVVLRAAGETGVIVDAAATFTDDPSGAPTWLQLHVQGHLGWPAAVDYRVVALTSPDAVR